MYWKGNPLWKTNVFPGITAAFQQFSLPCDKLCLDNYPEVLRPCFKMLHIDGEEIMFYTKEMRVNFPNAFSIELSALYFTSNYIYFCCNTAWRRTVNDYGIVYCLTLR